jgi:hypothetical protein
VIEDIVDGGNVSSHDDPLDFLQNVVLVSFNERWSAIFPTQV